MAAMRGANKTRGKSIIKKKYAVFLEEESACMDVAWIKQKPTHLERGQQKIGRSEQKK